MTWSSGFINWGLQKKVDSKNLTPPTASQSKKLKETVELNIEWEVIIWSMYMELIKGTTKKFCKTATDQGYIVPRHVGSQVHAPL